jgi:AcrR family transcriptional regulator
VCSAWPASEDGSPADLTARARIRDAAITLFAQEGFAAPLRRIAASAGVSPALVIHHFGSKAGLQAECDRHVGQVMLQLKSSTTTESPEASEANLVYLLANADEYGYLLGYFLRSLSLGGPAGRHFLEAMTQATAQLIERGVAAGTMRQSRDPAAQARYLTYSGLGMLLAWQAVQPQGAPGGVGQLMDDLGMASLELYTEGLLTSSDLLEAFIANHQPKETPDEPDS